jgi:transposase
MARAYSMDLRERVIGAIGGGMSCHQAAAQFRVAVSTAVKWAQRFRSSGSAARRLSAEGDQGRASGLADRAVPCQRLHAPRSDWRIG